MDISYSFGFVTACHAGDKHMVGATLASISYYCPNIPICLLVDGDIDVNDLEKKYNLIILKINDLADQEMKRLVQGSYLVKQIAMWLGPFEHYVWLDSDAILWGNIIPQINLDLDFQIFWPEISIPADEKEIPAWLDHFYFNLMILKRYDPEFEWRGHPYFSAGVYASKRNLFSYERWKELQCWQAKESGKLFKFGDQGILNYLVHSTKQRGLIRCEFSDLQHTRGMSGTRELIKDCEDSRNWCFPLQIRRPRIVHFCGRKPIIFDVKNFSKPFTIARVNHHRKDKSCLVALFTVVFEDIEKIGNKFIKKYLSKIINFI